MIKVSVLYPSRADGTFDLDYYCDQHIELVRRKLGAACKKLEVDAGVSGPAPGSEPPYYAMGHMLFDSVDAFQQAFAPHVDAIMGDIPNYTNVEPIVVISDVRM